MGLIIENGERMEGANSYASLFEAEVYCVARNLWPEGTTHESEAEDGELQEKEEGGKSGEEESRVLQRQKEIALIRAFDWLNTLNWLGETLDWRQTAAWPRKNVPIPGALQDGNKPEFIPENLVPVQVARAQIEMAALIFSGHDPLAPKERGGKVKSESHSKSEGGIETIGGDSQSDSYTYGDDTPVDTLYPSVIGRIAPFLASVPGKSNGGGLRETFRG